VRVADEGVGVGGEFAQYTEERFPALRGEVQAEEVGCDGGVVEFEQVGQRDSPHTPPRERSRAAKSSRPM
jgi:hypothetical protein